MPDVCFHIIRLENAAGKRNKNCFADVSSFLISTDISASPTTEGKFFLPFEEKPKKIESDTLLHFCSARKKNTEEGCSKEKGLNEAESRNCSEPSSLFSLSCGGSDWL
ncbi:hypothetical protein AVEN_10230-1 [Araneus ventricosus]|uniref:Uncharacterized protein n=1 Tax=Araneus ventricosus TaxID=182803 RepID=A0A4Y2J8J4_ARAVE|nr:hypothetical protein AVEN_10230-1 [Araneus ventricosus]